MFNLDQFIADSVTKRPVSMFAGDIEANKEILTQEIKGKKDMCYWWRRFYRFQLYQGDVAL